MSQRTDRRDTTAVLKELIRRVEDLERNRVVPSGWKVEVRNGCPHFVNIETNRSCCSCIPETSDVTASGFLSVNVVPAGTTQPTDTVPAAQPFPVGTSGLSFQAVSSVQAATFTAPGAFLYGQTESMMCAYTVGSVIPATYEVSFAGGGDYYTHSGHVIHGVTAVRTAVSNPAVTGPGPHLFPQATATSDGQLVVYLLQTGTDTNPATVLDQPTPTDLWGTATLTAQGELAGWYEVTVEPGLVAQRTVTLDTSRRVRCTTLLCDYTAV
mgnify:CR=1 FL=1